jgi:GNAT superfamily N-acetyltransferase
MEPLIRRAHAGDFDRIYPLFEQLWPTMTIDRPGLLAVFAHGAASDTDVYFCAEADGKIIGFCSYVIVDNLWQAGRIAYVTALVVDEAARSRGIGAKLIEEVVNEARSLGLKRVELDSGFPRERAHKFYEKLGFEKRAYLFSYIV